MADGAGSTGFAVRRAASAQVLVADPATPELDGAAAHHLSRVLRLRAGEPVVATDGKGAWTCCRFDGAGRLVPDGPLVVEPVPEPALTVAWTPAKSERPEWVVQRLTEVGVDRIVVLAAQRSVVRWTQERQHSVLERLVRVAQAACAQSRRVWVPEVAGVLEIGALGRDGLALAEPGGPPVHAGVTAIAVGPEGGWDDAELSSAPSTVGLGTHVLRAETAALAAGVLLCAQRPGTVWSRR